MHARERWLLGALGVILVAFFIALAALDDLNLRVPLLLTIYAFGFAVYAGAVIAVTRCSGGASLLLILVVATASRLVLVPSAPTMSTDIYRYLWEGRAIVAGFNPFARAPDDPALEYLRDDDYDGVSHQHMETIYPPVAQGVFALGAALRPSIAMQKLLFVLFDVGTVLLLIPLLRLRGIDPGRVIVYAWNPMVIFETGHSGHVDAVGIFFMVLGLWLLTRAGKGRPAWAFVALALSFLSKYFTAILVPYFALRRRYLPWLALAAVVALVGFLPFAGAGRKLFASLEAYSTLWQFNGLSFRALTAVWDHPQWIRQGLAAVAVVAILVQAARQTDVMRYSFLAIAIALLTVPTLYPWYVAWIVPFLCVFVNRSWILFTGLVFLSYLVWPLSVASGEWRLPAWVLALEYAPFLLLLVADALRSRKSAVTA